MTGFAIFAAALSDRAEAEADAARVHEMRARVWRRAAEVVQEGGVAARQIVRLVVGHDGLADLSPEVLARELGLFADLAEAEAWLGVVRPPERDYRALVMRSAEAARHRALARAGRAEGSGSP